MSEDTPAAVQGLENKSDAESLVSLSSSESEHENISNEEEEDPVTQTSPINPEDEVQETSEQAPSEDDSVSDDWLRVEHDSVPAPSAPLPVLGRRISRESGSGSYASSSKTVEVLSTSNYRDSSLLEDPVVGSITSLEDSQTEPAGDTTEVDVRVLATEVRATLSLSDGVSPGDTAPEESLAAGGEGERRISQEGSAPVSEGGGAPEKPDSGRMSPYLMINKTGNVAKVTEYESQGLLYAKPTSKKLDQDLLADEVAEDVLEGFQESSGEDEHKSDDTQRTEGVEHEVYEVGLSEGIVPVDPDMLSDLERRARLIAGELNQVMDGLKNSLHAMSVCSKQSIQLHREAVENLHTVVDANVKASYVFMSKFEELYKSLGPLNQIASQIQEVDMKLRVLERHFRTT